MPAASFCLSRNQVSAAARIRAQSSFEPQAVSEDEWAAVKDDLEASRRQLIRVLESLPPERLAEEGAAMGAIAHLAYHLGAIRQLLHRVRG